MLREDQNPAQCRGSRERMPDFLDGCCETSGITCYEADFSMPWAQKYEKSSPPGLCPRSKSLPPRVCNEIRKG